MDSMSFTYRHPTTNEIKTVVVTRADIEQHMDEQLYEKLSGSICKCEPIGETNVVECNCDQYIDEFQLVKV